MLSVAYGMDQADDDVQLHYPEVCYPAQGCQLRQHEPRGTKSRRREGLIHVCAGSRPSTWPSGSSSR